MLYIRSATTTISFVGASEHAHGSSHIGAYSDFHALSKENDARQIVVASNFVDL
jgi:hypothetical protein